MRLFISALISLSLLHVTSADILSSVRRRHSSLSKGQAGLNRSPRELEKRFDNSRFTFYDAGLGACGTTNSRNDFIVALNKEQYNGGSHCYEMITITIGSQTVQAQIVDECMGCPYGALDFSRGLFDIFAAESVGTIYGTWNFGTSPAPASSTTTKWSASSTSQYSTSSTSKTPTTTTSHSSTSTSSTSSTLSSSSSTSSSTSPTGTPTPTAINPVPTDVIAQFYEIMVGLGGLAVAAGIST